MSIDLRRCLNALSDVIINRPPPLRAFDQIYMKLADMLLQAELISRWFKGKTVLFVGDGDAMALSVMHLARQELLPSGPAKVVVLDFDERIVNSVSHFASRNGLAAAVEAELYNVADPLPSRHWQTYDGFYTNPPWGKSNDGSSVCAFIGRGMESVKGHAVGCIVIADHPKYEWTHSVQAVVQSVCLDRGFRVAEMLPEFCRYHLDDDPDLTSCSLVVERHMVSEATYASQPLSPVMLRNFYGSDNPLRFRYVRDLRNGGKLESRDVELAPLEGVQQ